MPRTNYDASAVDMLPPMRSMEISSRLLPRVSHPDSYYVDPTKETNAGIWTLFAGATVFLVLRLWCKITRRRGLWWDDYILVVSWVRRRCSCTASLGIQINATLATGIDPFLQIILTANNSIITLEFATGYVTDHWDDRHAHSHQRIVMWFVAGSIASPRPHSVSRC